MIVLGLTGSIGMGKTTLANQLASLGASVISADAIVHALLRSGGTAVAPVAALFPSTLKEGLIDRKALGEIIFHDAPKRRQLEAILHPLVIEAENRFIEEERRKGTQIAVLDIPLLFETGGETRCDYTLVATAPAEVQKERVMQRPGMSEEKFHAVLSAQMPDAQKRARADFVIDTGQGLAHSLTALQAMLSSIHET